MADLKFTIAESGAQCVTMVSTKTMLVLHVRSLDLVFLFHGMTEAAQFSEMVRFG